MVAQTGGGRLANAQLSALLAPAWRCGLPPAPPAGRYTFTGEDAGPGKAGPVDVLDVAVDLARRAGHSDVVVAQLPAALDRLDASTRTRVLDPLMRRELIREPVEVTGNPVPTAACDVGGSTPLFIADGQRATQTDATTCGSASLAMLAVAGDPVLALWLVTGGILSTGADPGRGGALGAPHAVAAQGRGAGVAGGTPRDRFRTLQVTIKRRTNHGLVPWPGALGTPPWGAAREARYADVAYTHHPVADAAAAGERVLRAALAAASRGVPVPLFTGGDVGHGIATAVPRHVVLLAAATDPGAPGPQWCWIYEPSGGAVHRVGVGQLMTAPSSGGVAQGHGPQDSSVRSAIFAALGGWPHVCWAILPAGLANWREGA